MKYLLASLLIVSALGCSKHDEAASADSLYTTPMNSAPVGTSRPDSTGLVVDTFMTEQQPDINRLKGIDPVRVVRIYDAFQPLRKSSTTAPQRQAFLKKQNITSDQLKSVLAEGDRLGWGKMLRGK